MTSPANSSATATATSSNAYTPSPSDIENWHEALKAETSMDFTNELLKARLHYAETPSDDARFAFVYYLLKSKNKLDLNNATFHLLELLSKDPLNKNYLYHLALAHFKLGDYQKCKKVLEQFAALSSDSTTTKSAIERNAAVLMRECENERRKELLVESAVIGASLSLGLLGVVVGGAIVASKFLTKK